MRALAGVLLLALGGCGGGVVGTGSGTGDDGTKDIDYSPRGLCTADFADTGLRCSTVSPDPFRGTSLVQWSDADKSRDAAALAVLDGRHGTGAAVALWWAAGWSPRCRACG
jgi:hypothetical protein